MSGIVGNNTNRGSGLVKSAAVGADSIDGSNIADDAIDSEHYTDGSIDNAHIADDAIDSEHYADGSIDNAHIADDAIDSEHYAAGSIDEAHIANNAVTLAKMAGGTDGNIISYDASGDPVAIATGSDGQVLTSTGAGSPPAFEEAAGGYIAETDYFSFDMSTATGTTVHTLSGSFTPKEVWMTFNPNGAVIGMVTGWMSLTNSSGSQNANNPAGKYYQGSTNLQCVGGGGSGYQNIKMSASASGQYTITNTKYSSPTGTGYFSLILFG